MAKHKINSDELFPKDQEISMEMINRYVDGQMTGEERNKFEKQLLNSELYADAVEGLSYMKEKHPGRMGAVFAGLESKIDEKTGGSGSSSGAKTLGLKQFQAIGIAASVALVMTFGIIYLFNDYTESTDLAMNKQETPEEENKPAKETTEANQDEQSTEWHSEAPVKEKDAAKEELNEAANGTVVLENTIETEEEAPLTTPQPAPPTEDVISEGAGSGGFKSSDVSKRSFGYGDADKELVGAKSKDVQNNFYANTSKPEAKKKATEKGKLQAQADTVKIGEVAEVTKEDLANEMLAYVDNYYVRDIEAERKAEEELNTPDPEPEYDVKALERKDKKGSVPDNMNDGPSEPAKVNKKKYRKQAQKKSTKDGLVQFGQPPFNTAKKKTPNVQPYKADDDCKNCSPKPAALLSNARVNLEKNNPDKALSEIHDLLRAKGNDPYVETARWYKATAEIMKGDTESAKATLNNIVAVGGFYKDEAKKVLGKLSDK